MKHTLLITFGTSAFLTATTYADGPRLVVAPPLAQIHVMCQNPGTRQQMIRELMKTKEGKQEMARMLEHDELFRSYYETHTVNPG